MKKDFRRILFLLGITSLVFSSCVPQKKYNELDGKRKSCEEENTKLKSDNDKFRTQNNELEAKLPNTSSN
jgi:hypothetical protein